MANDGGEGPEALAKADAIVRDAADNGSFSAMDAARGKLLDLLPNCLGPTGMGKGGR